MFILNKLERRELHAGQMLLIPRDTQVEGYHQQPLRLIDFTFEAILNNCDKLALSATGKEASQQPIQSFRPLDICSPLDQFLQLLTVLLQSGINCVHLHMLKHQELFLLLRGYYKKEELREFLHPVIARNFDFKEFVYREAAHHNSVEEIVKQSNMSRSTFQRKFQMEFGESPNSWLRKHICQRIVAELSQPGVSLKGVAMHLNISSAGSLTRFCKQNFHCTPSELKAGVEKKIGE